MVFKANIPQANDDVSDSQLDLLNNNIQLDASFGVDHYTFSNLTGQSGKHNQVTTPPISGGVIPTTIANEPKIYAFQDIPALGVLQYSRGPNNATPTPLTSLHSSSTPIVMPPLSNTPILDFNGLNFAICTVYATDSASQTALTQDVYFNGAFFYPLTLLTNPFGLGASPTSTALVLVNKSSSITFNFVFWTIVFHRLSK